jgi:nucleotide-binding universal stress UspA family protein
MTAITYNKILVGIDGSGHASEALKIASVLGPSPAEVTVLHVVNEKTHRELEEFGRIEHIDITSPAVVVGEQLLEQALRELQAIGHETATSTLRNGDVVAEILSCATELDVDLVVLGCRGLKPRIRSYLGSVSNAVLHQVSCNCIVVR